MGDRREMLLEKANTLPFSPGVYIMHDRSGRVIYVGKSRKLKARVSQYFQNGTKNVKTEKMVSCVHDFEYILCKTEIEALSLENTLIKQHTPRYNIKLKDAKSYPYIKLTAGEYPRITVTRQRGNDKGQYFGPYSGMSTAYTVMRTLEKTLGLPDCHRNFPKDIGKGRPCINLQIGRCCGLCTGKVSREEYSETIKLAAEILRGNTAQARRTLEASMYEYAEKEEFEAAARCRDTINALGELSKKQHVVGAPGTEEDIIGLFRGDMSAALAVLYIRDGAMTDRSEYAFGSGELTEDSDIVSFICGQYRQREYIPKSIYLSFGLPDEEIETLTGYLSEISGRKINVHTPQRGDARSLCKIADDNAAECAKQQSEAAGRDNRTLTELAKLLCLEVIPERIEAYDISNFGSEQLTAGMIVVSDGRFLKRDYRSFKIKSVEGTDDYASMREVISRRIAHLKDKDSSFCEYPDLILLDGGRGHVSVVRRVLAEAGIDIPVFGMVKDDKHRTRAICNEDGEIDIAKTQSVFVLIYKIQEEVHRFTVSRMENAKRKTIRRSSLEAINGIGAVKAKKLLAEFGGAAAVGRATPEQLKAVRGINGRDAEAIYEYFRNRGKNK